jgi:hypothetical protein
VAGLVLIGSPYVFGFSDLGRASAAFWILGLLVILYSAVRAIPLGAHLFLDVAVGILLMLAPSALGYRALITGAQLGLHLILGLAMIGLVIFTGIRGRMDELRQKDESGDYRDVA